MRSIVWVAGTAGLIGLFTAACSDDERPNVAVTTRFVIGRDGTVAAASDSGSTLSDRAVVDCIVRAFNELVFPARWRALSKPRAAHDVRRHVSGLPETGKGNPRSMPKARFCPAAADDMQ